jgi:hypothetical protein
MKTQRHLSDTQAILTYLAHIVGSVESINRDANSGREDMLSSICHKFSKYNNEYATLDNLSQVYNTEELSFIRNALKGGKYGNYTNGLIASIFGYCANI